MYGGAGYTLSIVLLGRVGEGGACYRLDFPPRPCGQTRTSSSTARAAKQGRARGAAQLCIKTGLAPLWPCRHRCPAVQCECCCWCSAIRKAVHAWHARERQGEGMMHRERKGKESGDTQIGCELMCRLHAVLRHCVLCAFAVYVGSGLQDLLTMGTQVLAQGARGKMEGGCNRCLVLREGDHRNTCMQERRMDDIKHCSHC